jgi:hypothetical protein
MALRVSARRVMGSPLERRESARWSVAASRSLR